MNLVEALIRTGRSRWKAVAISVHYQSEVNLTDRKIDISEASIAASERTPLSRGR